MTRPFYLSSRPLSIIPMLSRMDATINRQPSSHSLLILRFSLLIYRLHINVYFGTVFAKLPNSNPTQGHNSGDQVSNSHHRLLIGHG